MIGQAVEEFQQSDNLSDPRFREKLNGMVRIVNSVRRITGPGVSHLPDGVLISNPPVILPPIMFPVKVLRDGGADGNRITPATWTYTVTDILGGAITTASTVTHPRPNGSMTTYGGATGYGVGFYDENQTFRLWDAGEVPTTGTCVGTC